ncbi:NADPH:quinone oxidoreductase family protein [Shimia ponticola]|uniref:NADPH:quinone oxidoreductase family protein n=1 Tax=Shimia ponticola TaxID=2582893 RepID=UPI0011BE0B22|nr:NADPH:quinone oxidoreductase family protein [Shimia ponticola]
MRALQVVNFDASPELRQLEIPKAGRGQLRIRIEACGLNFADLLMMKGTYQETPEPPFTLGLEVAGVVDEIGPHASGFEIGDRVAVFGGSGGLAEYGCFPAPLCVKLPDSMDFASAAAFQVAYGTSHLALTHRANLQSGETLVVLGAAGGVGLTAVEIGKAMGAKVIAVARGAEKCAVAEQAGADIALNSETTDLKDAIRKAGGADVVYDPVGGDLGDAAMRGLKRGGRFLVIGFASGDVQDVKLNHLLVKNIAVHGFYWGGYLMFDPGALQRSMQDLFAMYTNGTLHPHIGFQTELADAVTALDKLRRRETTGKVVVTMDHAAP